MKLEMEGSEPLYVLFGVPLLTTGLILLTLWLGRAAPADVHLHSTVTNTSPEVKVMPQSPISIVNQPPSVNIREVSREAAVLMPVESHVSVPAPAPMSVAAPAPAPAPAPVLAPVLAPVPSRVEKKSLPPVVSIESPPDPDGTLLAPPKNPKGN